MLQFDQIIESVVNEDDTVEASSPNHQRMSKRKNAIRNSHQDDSDREIHETFVLVAHEKSGEDIEFIYSQLSSHFVFNGLKEEELKELAQHMFYCELGPGETIMKQGDEASSFFIVESGSVEVVINDAIKGQMGRGECFGELALLYNAPRSATIKAVSECRLWGIDRTTFRKKVEDITLAEYEINREFLQKVRFLNELTEGQKNRIASVLSLQTFTKNQVIVSQGDPASSFYIIKEGEVGIFQKDVLVRTLGENESFGEQALLHDNQFRQMTAKATADSTKLLALGRQTITQILGDQVENIIYRNLFKWTLKKSRLGRLPKVSFDKVLETLVFRKMARGETIIHEGDPMGTLFLVIINNKGLILEQDTILDANIGKHHPRSVRMIDDGILGYIDVNHLRAQVGSLEEIVRKHEFHQQAFKEEIDILNNTKLEDFLFLMKLGAGQFGQVYLVKLPKLSKLYALKCVSKYHIEKFKIQKHIQQEKQMLEVMDHQFIMKFLRSFKDEKSIYFLTEFIAGIELFDAIREIGLLSTSETQFYVAQMIEQLEYIHKKHVIYRDLKPENVMLDAQGYLKLIDMGTAKPLIVGSKVISKAFTIIGTPHYMAPEVMSGKGYNAMADIWSLGVCCFEFMCGCLPFGEDEEDPYQIYKIIQKSKVQYPPYMKDALAKEFIEQLLSKTPETRNGGSYTALRKHKWFQHFDWLKLDQRLLKVPLAIPKQKEFNDAKIKVLEKSAIKLSDQLKMDHMKMKIPLLKKKVEWDKIF